MTEESNLTLPLSVDKATVTEVMPFFFFKEDSIRYTQDAQVMPLI